LKEQQKNKLFDASEICEAIYNFSVEAIIITDQKGVIAHANPTALSLFDYKLLDLVGQSVSVLVPLDVRHKHDAYVEEFSHSTSSRTMDGMAGLRAVKKCGEEFPVSISLSPAVIDGQHFTVALVIDITESKKIKEKLQQHNKELEQRVAKRTEELADTVRNLEKVNAELKKAEGEVRKSLEKERKLNELKSRFVSMASHEFRTPLGTILSSLTLIAKHSKDAHTDKQQKHFLRIRSNVKHLTNVLNDFLSIDILKSDKLVINLEQVDLNDLFEELQEEFNQMKKAGQIIKIDIPVETFLFSDKHILKNIFLNLVSNAIKYSSTGKEILISVREGFNKMSVAIKDQGIGVPLEDQVHLFERFYRATNAANIQGTGLGLNIVKHYVELLHGTIQFKSKYEVGSTFYIEFPTEK